MRSHGFNWLPRWLFGPPYGFHVVLYNARMVSISARTVNLLPPLVRQLMDMFACVLFSIRKFLIDSLIGSPLSFEFVVFSLWFRLVSFGFRVVLFSSLAGSSVFLWFSFVWFYSVPSLARWLSERFSMVSFP